MKPVAIAVLVLTFGSVVCAAPDEQRLGKDSGYPVGKAARCSWLDEESMRVESFTHQGEIPGFYGGKANILHHADKPKPLRKAAQEPDYRWNVGESKGPGSN
jgi:hypothetical protein